ncbi:sensor histidine kinase [Acetobacterium paludosum]|uniref:histidine kinase n=1 Tax=Acetobacterium paludosum TaxID=52693 RepID=A0A923I0B5_9FIRM|nr:ATP-binding protein [Acetobacterium paludosum]MBC3889331.1 sensor histidine kinase [Acetobacterium paludosum]
MLSLNKLRMNLTLMNTGVLIGLLLFISIFLYVVLSMDVETNVNNNLKIYCSQLANEIDYLERAQSGQDTTEEEKQGYSEYTRSLIQNNISYVILNQEFKVLDQSSYLPLEKTQLIEIANHYFSENREKYLISNYEQDEKDYKICTYMVINNNGELKIIQAMQNMAPERLLLGNALRMIMIAVLIGATLSFLGGYFLSGRSLIPIKKSVERQQEFLADASHELRTPIAVIQTNLEVVKSSGDETVDSQIIWIDNAYDEVQRMHQIVEDLMFLARADSGAMVVQRESIDLNYLIRVVTEKMAPLAGKKGITLINNLDEDLIINGDEKQIIQLLIILLDNAIKYSGEKTAIQVMAKKNYQGISVEVIDRGIGIPKDEIDKVTQRFYRVDKARSRTEGGTGLGLSIANWIVEGHHAGMIIESEENKGTKIILNFDEGEKKK